MQPTDAAALNRTMAVMFVPSLDAERAPRVGGPFLLVNPLDLEPHDAIALGVEEVVAGLLSLLGGLELAETAVELVQGGVLGVALFGHSREENDKHDVVPSVSGSVPDSSQNTGYMSILSILAG